jgi:hypothetical protein
MGDRRDIAPGTECLGLGDDDLLVFLVRRDRQAGAGDLLKRLVQTPVGNARETHRIDLDGRDLEGRGAGLVQLLDHPQLAFGRKRRVEGHIHERFPAHVGDLGLQPFSGVDRTRRLVERHVDDRGRAPGSSRSGQGGDALVHGRARVHVGVHEARQDQLPGRIHDLGSLQRLTGDGAHRPVAHAEPPALDHLAVRQHQVAVQHQVQTFVSGQGAAPYKVFRMRSSVAIATCPRSSTGRSSSAFTSFKISGGKPT